MKKLFVVVLIFGLASCAMRSELSLIEADKRLERLEKEREKLKRENDPVGRTKTQIKISEILLTFIGDAIQTGDLEVLEHRLDEYVSTIQDAHQTMSKTGRDANKKPKGFKDLEIALRRQVRQLEDLGGALSFDQREPVERAKAQATSIRDELLKALFGGQNAPTSKS